MGIISQTAPAPFSAGRKSSRQAWDGVFGLTKEDPQRALALRPQGGRGRSALLGSSERALSSLLNALQSNAPGGWSDNRYEQTLSHFVGITYVAIHRLSLQFARAEFQVYKDDPDHPDGKRPVRRDEPAWGLVELLKRPNKQDTFGKLMYRWSQQRRLTGSALTWCVPNRLGQPMELYSIPTALAVPQAVTNPEYPEGYYRVQPVYPYGPFSSWPSSTSSAGAAIPAQWMMRFQYPHPFLRYDGYSPLTGMRSHIDAIEMIDKARHYLMRRGIFPNAVLNSNDVEEGNSLDDDQVDRIRAMFEEDHMGPENFGRLFVAFAGWKLEQWGSPPSEMGFDSSWDQLSSFILGGGFGITRPAAGMVEDSSYQTLFATMKQLHLITLEPECEEIGAELTRFLGHHWGDDVTVDVRVPRIDDHEITFSKISTAMQAKAIKKNEVRKMLDLPITREAWGEEFAGDDHLEIERMKEEKQAMLQQQAMMTQGQQGGLGGQPDAPGDLSQGSLGPRPGTVQGGPPVAMPAQQPPAGAALGEALKVMTNGHTKNGKNGHRRQPVGRF